MISQKIFIEADFDSRKGKCPHHCWPSCHPAQVGPRNVYGCRHLAWPQNRARDFVPIVRCGGKLKKCELLIKYRNHFFAYYRGRKKRMNILIEKSVEASAEIAEMQKMREVVEKNE